ncbi:CTP synthase [Candidatus Saccharibacteria bacterium]|nr:CTP synthase [Candidatus Saccharibacteria bacterium]MCB9834893.1 CTP synthase [Candidatus Nomurabacteria bacterium]
MTKYIFVTGGVMSGLGKGITAAGIGANLKAAGYNVGILKCDPYLNYDAGTLNPSEHGEVFVTKDGAETDLDLGHYERFLNIELEQSSSLMSGRILSQVIQDERKGKYLGKTVQVIPHVTNKIQDEIIKSAQGYQIMIVEIGGTIGDIEGLAFVEAIRQMRRRVGQNNVAYIHLVYLPYLEASQEIKTKPAQNSLKVLQSYGIKPDLVCARSDHQIPASSLEKLSIFADLDQEYIIPLPTLDNVYKVPSYLSQFSITKILSDILNLNQSQADFSDWEDLIDKINNATKPIKVAIVAKYLDNQDTYASIVEALKSAGWQLGSKIEIVWVDSEDLDHLKSRLKGSQAILVPGGFGSRGIEGKIIASQYARENLIPYLGICLGMQTAIIELSRNQLGLDQANSAEFDSSSSDQVIHLMDQQHHVTEKGGTMRLGDYPAILDPDSLTYQLYQNLNVTERHRHRYEVNNQYKNKLEAVGVRFSGLSPDKKLVEFIELDQDIHPFFVATQAHPEFRSRPMNPHPLFLGLISSALASEARPNTLSRHK